MRDPEPNPVGHRNLSEPYEIIKQGMLTWAKAEGDAAKIGEHLESTQLRITHLDEALLILLGLGLGSGLCS